MAKLCRPSYRSKLRSDSTRKSPYNSTPANASGGQPILKYVLHNCQLPSSSRSKSGAVWGYPVRGVRLRRFSFSHLLAHSWFGQACENLSQLFTPTGLAPTSANGAPIHLLKFEQSKRSGRAQTLSFLTHLAAIATILSIASQTVRRDPEPKPRGSVAIGPLLYSSESNRRISAPSSGPNSGGGVHSASPANSGFFPPRSSVQLAPPRLPDNANHPLPISTTIFDAQAPAVVEQQNDVGLPWMADKTNSGGSGDRGIGTGKEGGMGDGEGPGGGQGGSEQSYSRGVSRPTCFICPYPIYTDEAGD